MERILLGVFYLSGWHMFSSSCLLRQYHYVADAMTWTEAQTYCRKHCTDLATIETTEEINQVIDTVTSVSVDRIFWIGLYRKINWTWSDGYRGSGAEYRNWETGEPKLNNTHNYFCVQLGNTERWRVSDCSQDFPFICNNGTQEDPTFVFVNERMNWSSAQRYCRENFRHLATVRSHTENQEIQHMVWIGDQAWMVTRQTVKLRVKRDDPSVDLNDAAVKENILKKLQDELKDKGVSGVTLKWREQPDGKVFHKEEETPQKKRKTEL